MRSSIKKNLIIIVEEQQQTTTMQSSRFQKYSPGQKAKPQYKTQPFIQPSITPMNKTSQSFMESKTPIRNTSILRMQSSQFHHSDANLNNLKLVRNISAENSSKSLSESKRRLFFVSKNKKSEGGKDSKCRHEGKLRVLLNKVKKVLNDLEQLIADTYLKFGKIIEDMGKKFQKHVKVYTASLMKQQQKIEKSQLKLENILLMQAPICQKIKDLPLLDLSKINDNTTTEDVKHHDQAHKPTRRQVQTQRNGSKNFQFTCPARVNRKFSAFNETLNKMKRLSFEGSILKL